MEDSERDKCSQNLIDLLSRDVLPNEKNIGWDELEYLVNNLFTYVSNTDAKFGCIVSKLAGLVSYSGLVKAFNGEERDYGASDFPDVLENAEKCFTCMNQLLTNFQTLNIEEKKNFLIDALSLCATHSKLYAWNDDKIIEACQSFCSTLLQVTEYEDLFTLLCDPRFKPSIFKSVLLKLRPVLTKGNWMKNPSLCYIFHWFLTNVKHPHLAEFLSDVLPPSLMFIDHHAVVHKVLGIQCIHHIAENVPPSLLVLDGKLDVIHDAFNSSIFRNELSIIEVLYPCLLSLPASRDKTVDEERYDKIFIQLLLNLEMESNVNTKRAFALQVSLLIDRVQPIKHLKVLLEALSRTLQVCDGPEESTRIHCLTTLKKVIESCWPRMAEHCDQVIEYIVFLVYDLETDRGSSNVEVKEKMMCLCRECLSLLKTACEDTFLRCTTGFNEIPDDIPAVKFIKEIMESNTDV